MKTKRVVVIFLFVAFGLLRAVATNAQVSGKRPGQAADGPAPPQIQAGIAALVSAKASLEKAGDKWGGHRVKAIALIDKALKACGQSQVHAKGEMNSGPTDDMASLQAGNSQLVNAQNDFTNSTDTWGGRKDKALPLISQALQELQAAISTEKSANATGKRK